MSSWTGTARHLPSIRLVTYEGQARRAVRSFLHYTVATSRVAVYACTRIMDDATVCGHNEVEAQ